MTLGSWLLLPLVLLLLLLLLQVWEPDTRQQHMGYTAADTAAAETAAAETAAAAAATAGRQPAPAAPTSLADSFLGSSLYRAKPGKLGSGVGYVTATSAPSAGMSCFPSSGFHDANGHH
jgi:hypothetical protein